LEGAALAEVQMLVAALDAAAVLSELHLGSARYLLVVGVNDDVKLARYRQVR
jgi:hypothetical protein